MQHSHGNYGYQWYYLGLQAEKLTTLFYLSITGNIFEQFIFIQTATGTTRWAITP